VTPVPLDLPLRPAEAAEVADLVFDQAERKPLTGEIRNRLAARASGLRLESFQPWFGSLVRDPVHPSSYYLAVDSAAGEPLLLHFAVAAAPTSSIFHKPLLIGRMRRPNGPEMVLNAVPFGPQDRERIEQFAAQLDAAFLPKPQGARLTIAVEGAAPEKAFEAFRVVWKRTGKNVAALAGPADRYHAVLWAAIRAGWREGYSAGVRIPAGESPDSAKETIRQAAGFSRFTVDAARTAAAGDPEEQFDRCFPAEERGWIFDEFGTTFPDKDLMRLAVEWGPGLKAAGRLHEAIRQARGKSFDFELSFASAASVTSAEDLAFCLRWLRARGQAAQLAAPRFRQNLPELAQVCRQFQCTLSVRRQAGQTAETPDSIARSTSGRVNYTMVCESAEVVESVVDLAGQLLG
jgi:hypothetical protein